LNCCILVAGAPASGKSTIAKKLGGQLGLPVISKDEIKEGLFDDIGFRSREEKVRLGEAAMHLMYDFAGRVLSCGQSVILENNFEHASLGGLEELVQKCGCTLLTVRLTGDLRVFYERFCARNESPERHRGHVVNDSYPEQGSAKPVPPMAFEHFADGVRRRGMCDFDPGGAMIDVDMTDPGRVDIAAIVRKIRAYMEDAAG